MYRKPAAGQINQEEVHLYGSSRLGIVSRHLAPDSSFSLVNSFGKIYSYKFTRGEKLFELSNHLGNVLVTLADRVQQVKVTGDTVRHYLADIRSANDYYPFGMLMPGRKFNAGSFRYGFNGKENDNDVKGTGNQQDYGMRIYDPRLGRFFSVDPMTEEYAELTPFQFSSNSPISGIDKDGLEFQKAATKAARMIIKKAVSELVETGIKQRFKAYMTKSWYKQLADDAGNIMDILDESWWEIGLSFAPGVGTGYDLINTSIDGIKAWKAYDKLKTKIRFTENLVKFGDKYAANVENIFTAIEKRGDLRSALLKSGKLAKGEVAHHLIPVKILSENNVVQAAVSAGFDFNGTINGKGVDSKKHNTGGHRKYSAWITEQLTNWANDPKNKGFSPEQAREFIETNLIPKAKNYVDVVNKLE
ncbi:RHS repeat domain-containing protein [Flavihumibacter sp. UBA7668]|uniref:RHS repeat domain-containing protein n=1 Tax=Flavihumibacter sp. UBA7668 TaxID=1946542 RepID=UPI0025C3712C|nr:RHS repeat-associated core domain-containing protein [Flavihumibacter sp. UBA7668]